MIHARVNVLNDMRTGDGKSFGRAPSSQHYLRTITVSQDARGSLFIQPIKKRTLQDIARSLPAFRGAAIHTAIQARARHPMERRKAPL